MYNLQGDVTHIIDANKNIVGTYQYDAWGKILNLNSLTSVAQINPFRYRGYYYDTESGLYYLNSRYYNAEWGRFINADNAISGVGGDIRGYNLFVYCMNNPVNLTDEAGNWPQWVKSSVKWVASNIVKPVVKKIKNTLSKTNVTYSKGLSVNFSPGLWNFNVQGGVSIDSKGNVALQGSFVGGATSNSSISASAGVYSMVTNAPNINLLNGPGYQIGGSASIPIPDIPIAASFGAELNIIPKATNGNYYGVTLFSGVAPPKLSVELHSEWGTTATWSQKQFNIYDVANAAYVKIMEW